MLEDLRRKVWVVMAQSGDLSQVVAAFSDRAGADHYIKKLEQRCHDVSCEAPTCLIVDDEDGKANRPSWAAQIDLSSGKMIVHNDRSLRWESFDINGKWSGPVELTNIGNFLTVVSFISEEHACEEVRKLHDCYKTDPWKPHSQWLSLGRTYSSRGDTHLVGNDAPVKRNLYHVNAEKAFVCRNIPEGPSMLVWLDRPVTAGDGHLVVTRYGKQHRFELLPIGGLSNREFSQLVKIHFVSDSTCGWSSVEEFSQSLPKLVEVHLQVS